MKIPRARCDFYKGIKSWCLRDIEKAVRGCKGPLVMCAQHAAKVTLWERLNPHLLWGQRRS